MGTAREHVVSSFTIAKGALIDETYAAFAQWDLRRSKRENLDSLRAKNAIGAGSSAWLRDVAKVLNRRFDPGGRDLPLVRLAQAGCELDIWRPLLLWHMTRDEFLLRDFLTGWLFPMHQAGTFRVRPEDLGGYLRSIRKRGGQVEHAWSDSTTDRVASGLLKMATDFGLLRGTVGREFSSYHLPDKSFLYLLHAMSETEKNPRLVVDSPDWRMYLLRPEDVERELFRLHQFRLLEYHVAGSLAQLTLPFSSSREYAEQAVS
jgi:hypothetical protein